jgi:hypothetical protein
VNVGRGCAHDGANPHSGPLHSTATMSNSRSGQGPVGQLKSVLSDLGGRI